MEILQLLTDKEIQTINILLKSKALNQRNCTITLHYSNSGTLNIVERRDTLYSAKHESP